MKLSDFCELVGCGYKKFNAVDNKYLKKVNDIYLCASSISELKLHCLFISKEGELRENIHTSYPLFSFIEKIKVISAYCKVFGKK